MDIDFTNVNSISALKKYISFWLQFHYDLLVEKRRKDQGKRVYLCDYEIILRVGDLKEKEGLTNQKIAKNYLMYSGWYKDNDAEE